MHSCTAYIVTGTVRRMYLSLQDTCVLGSNLQLLRYC